MKPGMFDIRKNSVCQTAFHCLLQVLIFQRCHENVADDAVFVQHHGVGESAAAAEGGIVSAYKAATSW